MNSQSWLRSSNDDYGVGSLVGALGRDAVRTTAPVSSARMLDRLRTLQRQARPLLADLPHLRELDDRITDFLSCGGVRPD